MALCGALMQAEGYDVRFVTYRFAEPNGYDNHDIKIDAECLQIPIIFCNGVQKDEVCRQLGFFVDIWIDDFPVGIPKKDHLDGMLKGIRLNDLRAAPPVEIAAPVVIARFSVSKYTQLTIQCHKSRATTEDGPRFIISHNLPYLILKSSVFIEAREPVTTLPSSSNFPKVKDFLSKTRSTGNLHNPVS